MNLKAERPVGLASGYLIGVVIFGVVASSCTSSPTRPCTEAGEFAGLPVIKGDKQCMQHEDQSGKVYNHGQFTQWHKNGKVAIKGQFTDGKKSGVWAFYDENGAQTEERVYNAAGVQVGVLPSTEESREPASSLAAPKR